MAKIGRNAPCPCGSGKKYKQCCLAQDEAARQATVTVSTPESAPPISTRAPVTPAQLPSPPPDPHIEAINTRWEAYEARDYEGRIALFTAMLDEPELMDDEMAFEMLNTLRGPALEHDQRDRFDALITSLRDRLPEVYDSSASYYLDWQITNALAKGRSDALPALVRELTDAAKFEIDIFNNIVDRLAYHGQLNLLIEATRHAWLQVNEPGNVVPWGIDEFAEQAIAFVLFDHVERHAAPDPEDPVLVEQIEFYGLYNAAHTRQILIDLTGQAGHQWTLDDFDLQRRRPQDDHGFDDDDDPDEDDGADDQPQTAAGWQNLYHLSVEFLGYLYHEEGVPLTKGDLARQQIYAYILGRSDGQFEPRESMFDAVVRPRRQKRHSKPKRRRQPMHLLCPDHATFERFLGESMHFINPQWYKTAATFELVPAWLRFLELCGLIDAEQHIQTRQALEPIRSSIGQLWEKHVEDSSLQQSLQAWEE